MPARAPKARGEMRPTRPSATARITYQRSLEQIIDEMHRSTLYWIRATYRSRESEIAIDASPASALADELLFGRLTDGGRLTVDLDDNAEKPDVVLDIQPLPKKERAPKAEPTEPEEAAAAD